LKKELWRGKDVYTVSAMGKAGKEFSAKEKQGWEERVRERRRGMGKACKNLGGKKERKVVRLHRANKTGQKKRSGARRKMIGPIILPQPHTKSPVNLKP